MASGYSEADIYKKRTAREEDVIRRLITLCLKEKRPLTVHEIANRSNWKESDLVAFFDSAADYFDKYQDGGHIYVKLICRLTICEAHCARNRRCSGSLPECSGLHICKFYILSDSCRFGQQCQFGHDLTMPHNNDILRDNLLDNLPVEVIKYMMKQTDSRTASTTPKICKFYNHHTGCRNKTSGRPCPFLHICKHYLQDTCQFGKTCKRSHNILEPATLNVLNKHGIDTRRTPKEILTDLRETMDAGSGSEASSVDSNNIRGASRMAGVASSFQRMHMQEGPGQRSAMPQQMAASTGLETVARSISVDPNSSQTICLYHLKGRCGYGKSCHNVHCGMTYQWLYRLRGQEDWVPVDAKQNVEIEITYCDVSETEHVLEVGQGSLWVDFDKMEAKHISSEQFDHDVRRLSTISSVEMANQPLATLWLWSWKTQTGSWMEYGDDTDGYKSNIQSSDIEQAYMANPEGVMRFATQGHEYALDFRRMMQANLEYKTLREVKRRPKFVSLEDIQKKIKQSSQPRKTPRTPSKKSAKAVAADVAMVTAPSHWKFDKEEDILDHFKLVKLLKRDPDYRREYKEIDKLFSESMPSTASIITIVRIQNGDLWSNYITKKRKMEKKSGSEVVEKRLFHGTHKQYVDPICKQGFDFRLCGQSSGTAFGKGSYFATTAQYSNCYTSPQDRILFVVKVLVGDYIQGKKTYVRPPPKRPEEPHSELYDSCVDSVVSPKIFVIFDNNGQVYPEYIINYEMKFQD